MALIDIRVPDIGDVHDVAVIELLVQPGDSVALEQSLITLESDKASMEIPSPQAGVVKSISVKVGDTVNAGSAILSLEVEAVVKAPEAPAAAPSRSPLRSLRLLALRPAPKPTPIATCSSWAPAPAVMPRPFVPPTSA